MSIAEFSEIRQFAQVKCKTAIRIADEVIQLSTMNEGVQKYARARSISDLPGISKMEIGYGMKAWAAILSVDIVGSSNRALKLGARGTYITMHTYLPVMALIASKKGYCVGLRGDGLFAAYGVTRLTGSGSEVTSDVAHMAVGDASKTGKAMLEAVQEIINPALAMAGIDGNLAVRVGVDIGPVVITRIGIDDTQEVTTYGPAVNKACKMGTLGAVLITHKANDVWQGRTGGRVTRHRAGAHWRLDFGDLKMLER